MPPNIMIEVKKRRVDSVSLMKSAPATAVIMGTESCTEELWIVDR